MPPLPPPPRLPRASIQLHDLYSIAFTAARIAHRAAYLQAQAAENSSSASTDSTHGTRDAPQGATSSFRKPWPTQVYKHSQPGVAPEPHSLRTAGPSTASTAFPPPPPPAREPPPSDKVSLPPQAPDGTFTEMKHVNRGASNNADKLSDEEQQETTRKLDDTLAAYFADPAPEERPQSSIPIPHHPAHSVSENAQPTPSSASSRETATSDASGAHEDPPVASTSATPSHQGELPKQAEVSNTSPAPPPLNDDLDSLPEYDATTERRTTPMRASKVPSSRIARLMHYGTLGAGLAWGAAGSFLGPKAAPSPSEPNQPQKAQSPFMSDGNVRRLVDKLSRMRGAALKLGQFLSIQDSNLLPVEIERVLQQVQNSANYMPEWQMERVMNQELGPEWRNKFASFNSTPFAAASIGQVHHGVLAQDHPTHPNMPVAIKIQFPGIRESIDSDLSYLRWLLSVSALLPKGLFLESTIKQMRMELEDECDYSREAEMGRRFATIFNTPDGKSDFEAPQVVDDLCAKRVLTTQMMKGRPLSQVEGYSDTRRDEIATSLLRLSLSELFTHRLMQTDPNFSNFLYSPRTRKVQLIDFGATREYTQEFMDSWLRLLICAVNEDLAGCKEWSIKVGYLLGSESDEMTNAHVSSMTLLGSPFRKHGVFDFTYQTLTEEIKSHIPLMLAQRKTPPPKETYSLNRKLSGTFLICSKLRAKVDCGRVLKDVVEGYRFLDGSVVHVGSGGKLEVRHQVSQMASSHSTGAPDSTRSFHTSSRIFKAVRELERNKIARDGSSDASPAQSLGQAIERVEVAGRRQRKARERYGINLGDRWPRSLVPPVEAPQDEAQFDTIAQSPAGTSMAAPTDEGVQRREAIPAEQPSRAETPFGAVEISKTQRQAEMETKPPSSAATQPTLRGIKIPLKPSPPGAEDCCMSGCARCVYDLFKEDLEDYQESLSEARSALLALTTPPVSREEWDDELLGKMPSSDGSGSVEDHAGKADAEVDAVIAGLDPSMKAFLEMERKMKKKKAAAAAAITATGS